MSLIYWHKQLHNNEVVGLEQRRTFRMNSLILFPSFMPKALEMS